jgi:hypothetical protein
MPISPRPSVRKHVDKHDHQLYNGLPLTSNRKHLTSLHQRT